MLSKTRCACICCKIPYNIGIHVLEIQRARDDQNRSTLIFFAILIYSLTKFYDNIIHNFEFLVESQLMMQYIQNAHYWELNAVYIFNDARNRKPGYQPFLNQFQVPGSTFWLYGITISHCMSTFSNTCVQWRMRFHGGVSRWFSKQQTCSLDNIGGVEELNSYLLLTVQYDKLPHNYKLVLIVTSEYSFDPNETLL